MLMTLGDIDDRFSALAEQLASLPETQSALSSFEKNMDNFSPYTAENLDEVRQFDRKLSLHLGDSKALSAIIASAPPSQIATTILLVESVYRAFDAQYKAPSFNVPARDSDFFCYMLDAYLAGSEDHL